MTIKQVKDYIRRTFPNITCRWIANTKEYRINIRGNGEDSAYYTSDSQDAINTARSMQVFRNEVG